ncbi:DMT family transporter [Exilibacterium tricleocarpae]|uniref:DMT family transporter n=1 Tax=Exilibacterium tricleocarpae TaxID=2591008 RepID=A0A545TYY8_9GAMM|nr:DMT family transporter [Exilibacterium tricleocarpae]TQV82407.1 DMT family transporter [Exilibacterium tricleocarpae]
MMALSDAGKGMLLGGLAVVAFGLTLPATRFVIPYLDPVFIGLGRAVVAAAVAALLLVLSGAPVPNRAQLRRLIVVALGVVVGFPLCSAWAMQSVPASHGGVVLGLLPLATALVSVMISDERPSPGFWLVGMVGSLLVISFSLAGGGVGLHWGDLALLAAVASAAVGYALGGQLSKQLGGWQVICWALVISLPFILVPAALALPKGGLELPAGVWLSFLYLALVSQLAGFFLWNKGLALGGVARVSQTQLLQPFVTLLASAWLIGEPVDAVTIVFALLIVGTVAVGRRMPVRTGAG